MAKGKKKLPLPGEEYLHLPAHASFKSSTSTIPTICDTHTHLLSTFAEYRMKYPNGKYGDVYEFARALYRDSVPPPPREGAEGKEKEERHVVDAIVDVWCEAPIRKDWKEMADAALTEEQRKTVWGGLEYHFVIGVHPHEARFYNDALEADLLSALAHPRCVGWGEIGLDYHYDNSPREIQRDVFRRQLKHAVKTGKAITIHTREADEDVERILKEEVPTEQKMHIHCFTDSFDLAKSLLDHFPNVYIGITGVITYSTNTNTSAVISYLTSDPSHKLRILLETDAPYMVPSNLTAQSIGLKSGQKLPFSHSGMIPWTAEFVANVAGGEEKGWDAEKVLRISRENAAFVYGV